MKIRVLITTSTSTEQAYIQLFLLTVSRAINKITNTHTPPIGDFGINMSIIEPHYGISS